MSWDPEMEGSGRLLRELRVACEGRQAEGQGYTSIAEILSLHCAYGELIVGLA